MTWPDTVPPYKVSEDTSRFKYSCAYGSRSAVRIARIVRELRVGVAKHDDTVFFTYSLLAVLAKYDHNQMYYIGGTPESVDHYGGGGFAVSYPLAAELVLDGCIDRYDQLYGSDQRIQCHSTTWTMCSPYFQNDPRIDSVKKLIGVSNMDPDRTLQLITVRKPEAALQTLQMWRSKVVPTRSVISDSFESSGEDVTARTYKRHKSIAEINCGKCHCRPALAGKVFNVTAAKLSPELWDKAPRRQCCKIINGTQGGGVVDSVVQVQIRECNRFESVTPP
ncbi:hypothetical protein PRUPE_6G260500 [Prunus persica]|uniref:Uncharacterized protein n=1 Tax=Prunus persica TaxID=3760 RepID=M5W392_PRUPE|nr:hypothetical protein PRUPE_6G260500 [Prunus persica]